MAKTGPELRVVRANPLDLLLRRLRRMVPLSETEEALVLGLAGQRQAVAPRGDLYGDGHLVRRPCIVLSGWGCRQRELSDGRREIFYFLLPGDAIGVGARLEAPAHASNLALTQVTTADARPLADALASGRPEHSGLTAAFAMAAALEEASLLDHLVRVGRQTAYERTAHLLLEFHGRLSQTGLARDWRFAMPLTQEILADALGLSVVHMNRTLQQLRRDRLIRLESGQVELLEPDSLAKVADFTAPRLASGLVADLRGVRPPPL